MKNYVDIFGAAALKEHLDALERDLEALYGERGPEFFSFLRKALEQFVDEWSPEQIEAAGNFDPEHPYGAVAGTIFAIAYPDNIADPREPTLKSLNRALAELFPAVTGLHILPEREMSHEDLWAQDLLPLLGADGALIRLKELKRDGFLDECGRPTVLIEAEGAALEPELRTLLEERYNAHFNDGGFSQKSRHRIDPRFGGAAELHQLTRRYRVMLDYVVNHLDVDNHLLAAYRRGEDSGGAFLIITPGEYRRLQEEGVLEKTFRPRPFPLFTGLRKEPPEDLASLQAQCREVNQRLVGEGLPPLDQEIIAFVSILFKVENDQGLDSQDRRIFTRFLSYIEERGIRRDEFFQTSPIDPRRLTLKAALCGDTEAFLEQLGTSPGYGELLALWDGEIFGEAFFAYTTFSESQVDLNPASFEGFRMVVQDLFHLLRSGPVQMLRMDAIKYLWKEIGKRNFDTEEGNRLIAVIRRILRVAAPWVLALDEVNSPDPTVYRMGAEGGFFYLFGPVNTTVIAFNEASTSPMQRFYEIYQARCPENLVPFVMLSTHDGRSVQGLGVQLEEGNAGIGEFYRLKQAVSARGGEPKFRSVPAGRIPRETFRKVCREARWPEEKLAGILFGGRSEEGDWVLRPELRSAAAFEAALDEAVGSGGGAPRDYLTEWIIRGQTPYELCSTSRSAFSDRDSRGRLLTPEEEARRLALAQLYVLTLGQGVPAIYLNDLLGLENDFDGYRCTGRPRDLNRRRSSWEEAASWRQDPFRRVYHPLINQILELRRHEAAFYPGSPCFEFRALDGTLFLNHPYHGGRHALILGNLAAEPAESALPLRELAAPASGAPLPLSWRDCRTGAALLADSAGILGVTVEGYDFRWLIPSESC